MIRRRLALAAVAVLMLGPVVACSNSEDDAGAEPTPVVAPTSSPFSVEITGPDLATAGETVTATVTNTGRLPDGYQLQSDPQGAATFPPGTFSLGPGESSDVQIAVVTVPVLVRVQSISGGQGNTQAILSLGSQQ